jgi:simple sugar transport system permease protein
VRSAIVGLTGIAGGLLLFAVFVFAIGQQPLLVLATIAEGAFSSAFAWQNTLLRAAPLILAGLAVAIPAQVGLVVIGGEGALALGGLAAAAFGLAAAQAGATAYVVIVVAAIAGMAFGALTLALAGALRAWRGMNETIASLLISYIAIALFNHVVDGPLRDPASLNKPSTAPLPDAAMIGPMPGTDVHWGLALGVIAAVLAQLLVSRTTLGFAMRVAGGNARAARLVGLPVPLLLVAACALGGACAGLAGAIEVLAVHGSANASLIAGFGYTGILVAFIARQNPLAIIPVAMLLGGISASGGMLQRRLDMPDATVLVLQGFAFLLVLASETLYGRFRLRPKEAPQDPGTPTTHTKPAGATA